MWPMARLVLLPLLAGIGAAVRVPAGGSAGGPAALLERSSQRWPALKAATYFALASQLRGSSGRARLQALPDDAPRPDSELVPLDVEGGPGAVAVPPEWAAKLAGPVRLLDDRRCHERHREWSTMLFRARLRRDPAHAVTFGVTHTQCPEAEREAHIGLRLGMLDTAHLVPMRHVCPSQEVQIFEGSTFVLRPDLDMTLQGLLDERRRAGALPAPDASVQLLVDILRGLLTLERAGVVHFDLSPNSIVVKDGRAYIDSVGRSCLQHDGDDGDAGFGCGVFGDADTHLVGSSLRHAPEMRGGQPTGPSNNVWAAGLIFAEIVLGAMPTETFLVRNWSAHRRSPNTIMDVERAVELVWMLDDELVVRDFYRRVVQNHFSIELVDGLHALPKPIQYLLRGMLAKEESKRCTTAEALARAKLVLATMGRAVLPEAPLVALPSFWFDEPP